MTLKLYNKSDMMFYYIMFNLMMCNGVSCMDENKKRRVQWSTATDAILYERFKKLSTDTRIPSTRLLDEALEDLLVKHGALAKEDKKTP